MLAIVCQNIQETLFNTGQADRPCPNKPSKFKKKGCEKPSFLLISCITK
nr:MAG TPA: hypothetical protein [Caudoviricetes sp.]